MKARTLGQLEHYAYTSAYRPYNGPHSVIIITHDHNNDIPIWALPWCLMPHITYIAMMTCPLRPDYGPCCLILVYPKKSPTEILRTLAARKLQASELKQPRRVKELKIS